MNFLKRLGTSKGSSASTSGHTAAPSDNQEPEPAPRGRARAIAYLGETSRSRCTTTEERPERIQHSASPARTIKGLSKTNENNSRSLSPTDTIRPSRKIESKKDKSANQVSRKPVVKRKDSDHAPSPITRALTGLENMKESGGASGSQIPFPSLTALAVTQINGTWSPPEGIFPLPDDAGSDAVSVHSGPTGSTHFTASDFEMLIDFPATGSDITYWDEDDSDE